MEHLKDKSYNIQIENKIRLDTLEYMVQKSKIFKKQQDKQEKKIIFKDTKIKNLRELFSNIKIKNFT